MNIAAAIRRASKQARMAVTELDREVTGDLIEMYETAADDVRGRIASATDSTDMVPLSMLRELLRQIENTIDDLTQRRDELLADVLQSAVQLGTRPFTAQGLNAVGATVTTGGLDATTATAPQAVLDSTQAAEVENDTLRFVREFEYAEGLTLSDRLWRVDRDAKEQVTRQIELAVRQGWSATRAANEFLMRGEQAPGDVAKRVMRGQGAGLQDIAAQLANRHGGALYQAERVFRTEINRAHGEAFAIGAERTPGFAGLRYRLSPMHPAPDICDLFSSQNLYGLGAGVYPDRDRTPWPAHPNILSFLEVVFEQEITDADRAGKESSLDALRRMGALQRAAVLGKTKASYFDKGLLTTGMIRASTASVAARIEGRNQP